MDETRFWTMIEAAWGAAGGKAKSRQRSIPGPESVFLFLRGIRGRVQLTQATADPRVGVRVDYDNDCSAEVERFAADLRDMGSFETWRHSSAEPSAAADPGRM